MSSPRNSSLADPAEGSGFSARRQSPPLSNAVADQAAERRELVERILLTSSREHRVQVSRLLIAIADRRGHAVALDEAVALCCLRFYCLDEQAAIGAVAGMVSEKAEEVFLDRVAKDVVSGAGNEPRTPAVTQYLHSAAIAGAHCSVWSTASQIVMMDMVSPTVKGMYAVSDGSSAAAQRPPQVHFVPPRSLPWPDHVAYDSLYNDGSAPGMRPAQAGDGPQTASADSRDASINLNSNFTGAMARAASTLSAAFSGRGSGRQPLLDPNFLRTEGKGVTGAAVGVAESTGMSIDPKAPMPFPAVSSTDSRFVSLFGSEDTIAHAESNVVDRTASRPLPMLGPESMFGSSGTIAHAKGGAVREEVSALFGSSRQSSPNVAYACGARGIGRQEVSANAEGTHTPRTDEAVCARATSSSVSRGSEQRARSVSPVRSWSEGMRSAQSPGKDVASAGFRDAEIFTPNPSEIAGLDSVRGIASPLSACMDEFVRASPPSLSPPSPSFAVLNRVETLMRLQQQWVDNRGIWSWLGMLRNMATRCY